MVYLHPYLSDSFFYFFSSNFHFSCDTDTSDKRFQKILPSEDYFGDGLYTFDIGQNDVDGAFYSKSEDQVAAFIPTILSEFETGVEVQFGFLSFSHPIIFLENQLGLNFPFSGWFQRLYNEGARSFWIHGMGPLGCLPRIIATFGKDASKLDQFGCVNSHNRAANLFNSQLHDLCAKLGSQFVGVNFTYVDIFAIKLNLIANFSQFGKFFKSFFSSIFRVSYNKNINPDAHSISDICLRIECSLLITEGEC